MALIDAASGGLQKPAAGVLASHSSLTGAPEQHAGEAVEQEAHNVVASVGAVGMSAIAGVPPTPSPPAAAATAAEQTAGTKTAELTMLAADARDVAGGGAPGPHHDKTKAPVERALWANARPAMHALGAVADTWERAANALAPTSPPFPAHRARCTVAAVLLGPPLLVSLLVSARTAVRGATFLAGVAFFGRPLFVRATAGLDACVPGWKRDLYLRKCAAPPLVVAVAEVPVVAVVVGAGLTARSGPQHSAARRPDQRPTDPHAAALRRGAPRAAPAGAVASLLSPALAHAQAARHRRGPARH